MEFFRHAESWVLVSFILFIALLVYLKVPGLLAKMLDERSARIGKELDDARTLREEAAALLAEYKAKRASAEKEAADILASARSDAQAYAEEQSRKLADALTRRKAQAEQKIAQAEAAAIKEVRNSAADLAIAAAARVLKDTSKGKMAEALITDSIKAVKSRLN